MDGYTQTVSRPRLIGQWTERSRPGWRAILWENPGTDLAAEIVSVCRRLGIEKWGAGPAGQLDTTVQFAALSGRLNDLAKALGESGFIEAGRLLREVIGAPELVRRLRLPKKLLTFERPAVVGIINVTPDSFSDGGRDRGPAEAVERALEMERAGAAIIEVGGEKAGPGEPVSEDVELSRVMPVLEGLRARSNVAISIDTRKPGVARRAAEAGAGIVNDVNGFRDPEMRRVVLETGTCAIVMHIQGEARVHQPNPVYDSVIGDIGRFLFQQTEQLKSDGVNPDRLVIDPGPAFGKTTLQDLRLMADWAELRGFPYPLMAAVSRKRFIGETLGLPVDQRLIPTLALTAFLLGKGCDLIRAHDVAETVQVVKMVTAVLESGSNSSPAVDGMGGKTDPETGDSMRQSLERTVDDVAPSGTGALFQAAQRDDRNPR